MNDHPQQEIPRLDAEPEKESSASPREKLAALKQGVSPELRRMAVARNSQGPAPDKRVQTIRDHQTVERLGVARKRVQKAVEGHEEASNKLLEASKAAESEAREKQEIVSSQTANLEKVQNLDFSNLDNLNSKSEDLPKKYPLPSNVATVEVATPLGFAPVDRKVIKIAAEVFPDEAFDLVGLARSETQFKIAVLDALISGIRKMNMPGIANFGELNLKNQKQLVWNTLYILPHLDIGLKPGAVFTQPALRKSIDAYLEIERQLFQPMGKSPFRPINLVDEAGVVLDRTLLKRLMVTFLKH